MPQRAHVRGLTDDDDGHGGPDPMRIGAQIDDDLRELVDELSLAMLLERDRPLQQRLSVDGSAKRMLVLLPHRDVWLEVGAGETACAHRRPPAFLPVVSLLDRSKIDPGLKPALAEAAERTRSHSRAQDLIGPIASVERLPDRKALQSLIPWLPVIEKLAYRCSARILSVLDAVRPAYVLRKYSTPRAAKAVRRGYWANVSLMGRLTLIASSTGARPWLSDMAQSFRWEDWTPTRPLTRERNLWLTAIAARAAVAFGPDCIGRYLERLERRDRFGELFDCLIALTAIGLAEAAVRDEIATHIERIAGSVGGRALEYPRTVVLGCAQAVAMLRYDRGQGTKQPPLSVARMLAMDPQQMPTSGGFAGLSILPQVLAADVIDFLPPTARRRDDQALGMSDADISSMLINAWTNERAPLTAVTLQ